MKATPPAKVQVHNPVVKSTATRKRMLWGPFDFAAANVRLTSCGCERQNCADEKQDTSKAASALPGPSGFQMDPNGQMLLMRIKGFCSDCTVVQGSAFVAKEDGSRVDVAEGAYLHHLLIINVNKPRRSFYNCEVGDAPPIKGVPSSYFLGSGVDNSEYYFTTPDGSYNSGYYIGVADQFVMQAEIVNYNPKPQKWYIAADIEYTPGKPAGAEDVSVTDFNVVGCSGFIDAGYYAPDGAAQWNKTSPKFILSQDGTILRALGHLHDGGTNVQLLVNGKVVCDSKATYGGAQGTLVNDDGSTWESISSMSSCHDPVPVKKGDVMTIVSAYDTDLHPLRQSPSGGKMEEMGIYTIFFATK
jgi:hypothetical protein